jgi:extracellular matrix regulatory protein A
MGQSMNQLIHIGFGNIVNTGKIIAIVSPDSAPVKRMVQRAKENGIAIDATQGRKTKAVLVMENSQVVLSALLPETIAARAQVEKSEDEEG